MSRFDLGVGLALMPGLVEEIDAVSDLIDCLEVEPQTFWLETGDPDEPFRLERDELLAVTRRCDSLLAHGVTTPVGGSRLPAPSMARLFAETVTVLDANLVSEHLSFNESTGWGRAFSSAFFLPPRQTWAGVDAAVASISVLRGTLAMPFSVETPVSYLQPRADELPDGTFMSEVVTRADCGILLDLHNLWTNERNGRQSVADYMAQVPLDRVWEVHLAGGLEHNGYWLDAHSGLLHPDLLRVAAAVLPQLPAVRAVVYEILPEFVVQNGRNVLRADLESVQRLVQKCLARRTPVTNTITQETLTRVTRPSGAGADGSGPGVWEQTLAHLAIGRDVGGADRGDSDGTVTLAQEMNADPGMELIRELVAAGRSGRVSSSLPLTIELLISLFGIDAVDQLLATYAADTFPGLWGSQEGRRFADWARVHFSDEPLIQATLGLDTAALDYLLDAVPQTVTIGFDPMDLMAKIKTNNTQDTIQGVYCVTVGP